MITYSLLRKGHGEKSIGTVYAANTVGAIIGVFFSTHIGLPFLGLKGLICVGAGVDIVLGLVLLWNTIFHRRVVSTIALGGCTLLVGLGALAIDFDRLRMASGVYRSGTLFTPETHESLYHRDGKTASIDVIKEKQSDAVVIMTNGKPDASLFLDGDRRPAHDATTQTLSGVLPLAVHPEAKTVAVIGFGSGMTSAMLLGSKTIETLDTIEIERSMVEGAEQFRPRNELVYTDPRSRIIYEDARTYFSAQKARYDVIVSEPSNPWVSGVATLFSEEFYERIVKHINEDGLLIQWLQLYELGPELLSSVLSALSKTFKHYTLFATDDHNILIVARMNRPIGPLSASIFESPLIKHELWRHRILNLNVLEAYRVANRQALEPVMMSYESPPNSDYFPYLDAHAARSRFLRRSSVDIAAASGSPVPVFEMLGGVKTFAQGWLDAPFPPLSPKQSTRLTRAMQTAQAVAIGRRLLGHDDANPEPMPTNKISATNQIRAHMVECKITKNRGALWRDLATVGPR